MNSSFKVCGALLTLLSSGCAASYTPIRPKQVDSYQSSTTNSPIRLEYQFDALKLRGANKRYAKREAKAGYHIAAVRVTNTTEHPVHFSRDLTLLYGDRAILPTKNSIVVHDIKQGLPIYLLYVLLNFQIGGTRDVRTGQTSGGTFIPTGPFIAAGNMLGANAANVNLRREFEAFDLTDRTIQPGETVEGILAVRETSVAPMRLEERSPAAPASGGSGK